MKSRRQFILIGVGGLVAAALAPGELDLSRNFGLPFWDEAHADKGGGSGNGGGNGNGNGGGNSGSGGGQGNGGGSSGKGSGSQGNSSNGSNGNSNSGSSGNAKNDNKGNPSDNSTDDGDARTGRPGIDMPGTAKAQGTISFDIGGGITVRHPNGTTERISGGRYEMRDSRSRTIINRQATSSDMYRLENLRQ